MKEAKDYRYLLFDLDGTLTDSFPGISRCVQYALDAYGIHNASEQTLRKFCGPPLMDSFQNLFGMDYAQAEDAVAKYREEYTKGGIFENEVYEGIPELLKALRGTDKKLLLATSKPETMAHQVLDHFGLKEYFHIIAGADLRDDVRHSKADVIREALLRMGIESKDHESVLMIGDRLYDVKGAQECGLDCLGVYYGYAEAEELEAAGARYIVETVDELRHALLGE